MKEVICFHKPDEINGYLSNWYPSEFTKDGILYTSMEQYMMHQKQDHVLAECAVRDKIWGIGLSMKDDRRFDINAWQGKNLLGFTLMCVRTALH